MGAVFEIEQAGCESCVARVRRALEPLASVAAITIDEQADLATVRLGEGATTTEAEVGRALEEASAGSGGHVYRVRPGSWRSS